VASDGDRVKLICWDGGCLFVKRFEDGEFRWPNVQDGVMRLSATELADIDNDACPCCGNALHRIGEDTSERLDIVPAQFRVLVVRRPRYACRACENVVTRFSYY
jgi:transposase